MRIDESTTLSVDREELAHRSIVFVGGVSGSGKTTACRRICELAGPHTAVIHIGNIACRLASVHGLAGESIEITSRDALERLQRLVVEVIADQVEAVQQSTVLDGHFVLAGDARPSYNLPLWFFEKLRVTRLVLCAPSLDEHRRRIVAEARRHRPSVVTTALAHWVGEERRRAEHVAAACGIPLNIVTSTQAIDPSDVATWTQPRKA